MSGNKAEHEMISRVPDEQSPAPVEADEPKLAPEAQEAIATQLRAVYSEMLSAPLPDRFTRLLAELAKNEDPPKRDPKG